MVLWKRLWWLFYYPQRKGTFLWIWIQFWIWTSLSWDFYDPRNVPQFLILVHHFSQIPNLSFLRTNISNTRIQFGTDFWCNHWIYFGVSQIKWIRSNSSQENKCWFLTEVTKSLVIEKRTLLLKKGMLSNRTSVWSRVIRSYIFGYLYISSGWLLLLLV